MFSKLFHSTVRCSSIPFFSFWEKHDDIPVSQINKDQNEIKETGWDRVVKMYTIESVIHY